MARYVPDRGHLVWLEFNPQAGHEQAGHRPALVLSPRIYNGRSGLAVVCPITSTVRGYPFEVLLPSGLSVEGVVMADQLKSLDWRARKIRMIASAPEQIVQDVLAKARVLLD